MIVDLRNYRLPLLSSLDTAHGSLHERVGLLVSVTDGELIGWGEAAPLPGWSARSLDLVTAALAAAAAGLELGIDNALDSLEVVPEARAGLAGALADLTAQRRDLSLSRSLDPDAASSVAVNALVSASAPDAAAQAARAACGAGMSTIKLKVAVESPEVDIERVAAVREAIGSDVELRLDANGGWTVPVALRLLEAVAGHDIAFCEEPVSGLAAIAEVGAASALPVGIDESARSVDDVAAALGTGTIDVVVVKPQAIGGPDLAMQAVRLVREFGGTPIVTTMIDSAIGVAHALHVAAASGVELAHGLATSAFLRADVGEPPSIVDGRMMVPTGPGLGVKPR